MRHTELGRLCIITQGGTIGRFRDPAGVILKAIQIRNLNTLEPGGDWESYQVDEEKVAPYRVRPDQVVVGLRGTPVKAAVVPAGGNDWVATSNVAILTPRALLDVSAERIDPYYLAGFLRSEYLSRLLSLEATNKETAAISVKALRALTIPLPSVEQQEAFSAAFKAHDKYVSTAQEVINLRAQRLERQLVKTLGDVFEP